MTRTAVGDGDAISRRDQTKPARPRTQRRLPRWSELRPLLRPRPLRLDPTQRRLSRALTVADLRTAAKRRTPRAVFDYTDRNQPPPCPRGVRAGGVPAAGPA